MFQEKIKIQQEGGLNFLPQSHMDLSYIITSLQIPDSCPSSVQAFCPLTLFTQLACSYLPGPKGAQLSPRSGKLWDGGTFLDITTYLLMARCFYSNFVSFTHPVQGDCL